MSDRIVVMKIGPGSVGNQSFTIDPPAPGYRVSLAHLAGEGGPISNLTSNQYYLLRVADANGDLPSYPNKVQFNYTLIGSLDVFGEVIFEKAPEGSVDIQADQ